ncbi:IS3 family transposase [Acidithrix ferrooxidans]|uniref:IS3 family transposase n=1 Tax=Acidithrix ferrooxidans TaxID=1280514 RepID=UPI0013648A02|nr:IS3 family transposase [Acidithrix ferrooxidans]
MESYLCHVYAYYRLSVGRKYLYELNSARENLKENLLEAFTANRRIYGAPRLTHELRDSGIDVSRATVSRLMAELSISGACGRAKTITTRPDKQARKSADLSTISELLRRCTRLVVGK